MILQRLSIVNYRNIAQAELRLSSGVNCLVGPNGAGKTNVLDAVHYLSFCRSSLNPIDSQSIRHGQDYFVLDGQYVTDDGLPESVCCGMKRGGRKRVKRNQKEYRRLSEHIGLVPMVVVSPADSMLIDGGSEERRRLMDMVISQYDHAYIEALGRYAKALQQRNAMLKEEGWQDDELMAIMEERMAEEGERVYRARAAFVAELEPVFQRFYDGIAGGGEQVGVAYTSHCQRGPLLDVIRQGRDRDRAVGYSLHGVHRDDLGLTLSGYPMRHNGSQGQAKTFAVALKLAQFDFLRRTASHTTPLLLLDDIFDKLDAGRVERIVRLVSASGFGQIFITDTNRGHLDQMLRSIHGDYRMFAVADGEVTEQ